MIEIIDNLDPIEAAKIALSNRLFVNGWELNRYLHCVIAKQYKSPIIHLALRDKEYIGVVCSVESFYDEETERQCMFFIRKKYRRQGIATLLTKSLRAKTKEPLFAYQNGSRGCEKFFRSVNIDAY